MSEFNVKSAPAVSTPHVATGTDRIQPNCEIKVSGGTESKFPALHADKGRGRFTQLVALRVEGHRGVQRYWMNPADVAALNVSRLNPSGQITVRSK